MKDKVTYVIYFLKRHMFFVLVGIIIILIAFFVYRDHHQTNQSFSQQNEPVLQQVELNEEGKDEFNKSKEIDDVMIDIKGEVYTPGVYEMKEGQRVIDVISRAGGMTDEADETKVNLAQKINDEMVIIIPKQGEEFIHFFDENIAGEKTNKIRINEATVDEISTLNGIGPKKAQAIIDYRKDYGPFQDIDDLLEVNGIGEKTLNNFRDDIIVP